jgi:competence protein ComEA
MAARIIKYRSRLGGFVRLDQLLEVYGIKAGIYSGLLPRLEIDTSLIKRLKINSIEYNELRKHPYLSAFQAKGIIKYRELKGKLKGVEDLEKNNLLTRDELIKIKPYLSFE